MKYILMLALLPLSSLLTHAQDKPNYILFGYEAALRTYDNAYGITDINSLPADLTSIEYLKDQMIYSNWNLKFGSQDRSFLMEADLSGLIYIIGAAFREGGGDTIENPQKMIGIGKLKNIEDNTQPGAEGFGYNLDIINMDMAFGLSKGFYAGFYFGWSTVGIGSLSGTNPSMTAGKDVYLNMRETTISHAGFAFHYAIEDHGRFSLRYNGLWAGRKSDPEFYDPDIVRKGFEIFPSFRYFPKNKNEFGVYFEAFYKFQKWKDYEVPAIWTTPASTELGTMSGMTNHLIGLRMGMNIPFNRSDGKVNKNWLPHIRGVN